MTQILPTDFKTLLANRQNGFYHRQLLVISGSEPQGLQQLTEALAILSPESLLMVGFKSDINIEHATSIVASQAKHMLGQEFQIVVYNCFDSFRGNALVALSGVIRRGGLMILVTPPLEQWPNHIDPDKHRRLSFGSSIEQSSLFITHLIHHIKQDPHILRLSGQEFIGELASTEKTEYTTPTYANVEQQNCVKQIIHLAEQKQRGAMVLNADRGRGKTAALGIAASKLISASTKNIIITSPRFDSVKVAFDIALSINGHLNRKKLVLHNPLTGGTLHFLPLDEVTSQLDEADLVLVDEAASIPSPLLKQIESQSRKVVFSSTIHGYEGTGRGFEVRFKPYLLKRRCNTHFLTLTSPVRWEDNDVLEAFWFKAFNMTQYLPNPPVTQRPTSVSDINIEEHSADSLIRHPNILHQIFQILVDSHYQTTPDDLIRLLDADDHKVIAVQIKQQVVAAAVVILEGKLKDEKLINEITLGRRRVNGHLMPQSLSYHLANPDFCKLSFARITRIAVVAEQRRSRIGEQILNYIQHVFSSHIICTSFGAELGLLRFWSANHYVPVRLGFKREASSGEHNVSLVNWSSIPKNQIPLFTAMRKAFAENLIFAGPEQFRQLESDIFIHLLAKSPQILCLSDYDRSAVQAFILGNRQLLMTEKSLQKHLLAHIDAIHKPHSKNVNIDIIFDLLVKRMDKFSLQKKYAIPGKKALEQRVKQTFKDLTIHVNQ
ncbi:GNAT family N-acetyltransferase [Aestuariibacter sp. AA17]|uniref:GNAT family N-acetyltransferase n=1 Tax=Fluctibacter corallii TaxID=2984329 RepID=A0ABT3A3L9_9ALTE|nr:GNAT family N-acetyltransferase [Aestuariibacter sp. AA17]MCV2883134.1 GNAT family N-acetyltransferase [Aestuariibacter sp. AA17]